MTDMRLPHLAARIFNTPLMIAGSKLDTILSVVGPKLDLDIEQQKLEHGEQDQRVERKPFQVLNSNIALIPIYGTLVHRTTGLDALSGLLSYQSIKAQFQAARQDNDIEAIIFDIDSYGGEGHGLFDLADFIFDARGEKPMTAIANESAYSAAYLIASAADEIVVPRTGGVGSVGVIAKHIDYSAYNEKEGFKVTTVFAGARKNDFSPDVPLSDKAMTVLVEHINRSYDLFVDTVARNRNMAVQDVRDTEAGFFVGRLAIGVGFADKVSPADDAIVDVIQNFKPNEVFLMKKEDGQPAKMSGNATDDAESLDSTEATVSADIAHIDEAAKNVDADTSVPTAPNLPKNPDAVATDEAAKPNNVTSFADAAEIAQAAADGGCPEMTAALLREGGSLENAKKRINAAGQIRQLCQLAGMEDKADGFINAGLSTQAVRAKLFDAMVTADSETNVQSHLPAAGHGLSTQAPIEDQCKAEWDRSAELRSEFGDSFDAYVAYRKNESNISVLRNRG